MIQILHSPEDEQDLEPSSEEEALLMAERLNDRRVQLAAFLKLAIYLVIDMVKVAPIWAEYIRVRESTLYWHYCDQRVSTEAQFTAAFG